MHQCSSQRSSFLPVRRKARLPGASALAIALAMALPAHAQDASGDAEAASVPVDAQKPAELDAVVVTAQKRSQSIMEVPISITAIGAEEIEAKRIKDVEGYIFSVPNATFTNSGSYWGKTVSFRGISRFSGGKYEVISVSVDDAGFGSLNSNAILSSKLMDIERIEVLRGPQGTLNGRNSLGGSINIVNAAPDPTRFQFKGTLDLGRFGTAFGRAVVNAPLSDDAALRGVVYGEHSDGMMENVGPSGGGSGYDNGGARLALRWQPGDALTLDASLGYEKQDRGMENWTTADFTNDGLRDYWLGELDAWGGRYPGPVDLFADAGNNGGKVSKDIDEMTRIEDWIGSFKASYDAGGHRFDLIYGYFDYSIRYREDYDQTEYAWWYTERAYDLRTHSLELRASSSYDGPVNWVAGVNYLDERIVRDDEDRIGEWAVDGTVPTVGGGYVPAFMAAREDRMRSLGLFANLYWDFGEHWHLSAGGRYSVEKTLFADDYVFDIGNPDLAVPKPLNFSPEASLREFSPRVALNYDLSPKTTVYAQYATGYRAGYSNTAQAIDLGAPEAVDPEHVRNFEVGLKSRFWDNRAMVSASVFSMDYTDLQVQTLVLPENNPYPFDVSYDINAGSARSRGFEFEGDFLLTDRLRLHAGVGYTDAKIEQLVLDGVEYRDRKIPNVRPWTANATLEYAQPLANDRELRYRADYTWQDAMHWQGVLEDPAYFIPKFDTLDASLTYGPLDQRWSVSLYAENLLDEAYYNSVGWVEVGARGRMVFTPPRTFGLRFTFQFDRPR